MTAIMKCNSSATTGGFTLTCVTVHTFATISTQFHACVTIHTFVTIGTQLHACVTIHTFATIGTQLHASDSAVRPG